jgi:pimeloyl-ACP methyl ester carboxylesterase
MVARARPANNGPHRLPVRRMSRTGPAPTVWAQTGNRRAREQRYVPIGGIDQWIQLRGEDRDNPVPLVLHGGPGWPNAVFTPPLRPWERHFTVVQWDHRGAGKTLARTGKAASGPMTFDRRVTDAVELRGFRRGRQVPAAPGPAPGGRQRQGRRRPGGRRRRPDPLGPGAWTPNMARAFRTNLPTPNPNPDRRLLVPLAPASPPYRLGDLASLFGGFRWSTAQLFDRLPGWDARRLGPGLEVRFFLVQGERDVITLTSLATEYFGEVQAPTKALALIPDAGHFAAFTQPDRFLAELRTRVRPLAATPA